MCREMSPGTEYWACLACYRQSIYVSGNKVNLLDIKIPPHIEYLKMWDKISLDISFKIFVINNRINGGDINDQKQVITEDHRNMPLAIMFALMCHYLPCTELQLFGKKQTYEPIWAGKIFSWRFKTKIQNRKSNFLYDSNLSVVEQHFATWA